MENLRVSSFNCTGIKSSVEFIAHDLCNDNDIIALQETWLLPHDLPICSSIHPDFCAFATSSVDVGAGVLRGRPYGGLAFLYRRSLGTLLAPVTFDDDRILGLQFKDASKYFLFVNVYFPTQTNDNVDLYHSTLGRATAIIHSEGADAVCVLGDSNANCHTPFFEELRRTC